MDDRLLERLRRCLHEAAAVRTPPPRNYWDCTWATIGLIDLAVSNDRRRSDRAARRHPIGLRFALEMHYARLLREYHDRAQAAGIDVSTAFPAFRLTEARDLAADVPHHLDRHQVGPINLDDCVSILMEAQSAGGRLWLVNWVAGRPAFHDADSADILCDVGGRALLLHAARSQQAPRGSTIRKIQDLLDTAFGLVVPGMPATPANRAFPNRHRCTFWELRWTTSAPRSLRQFLAHTNLPGCYGDRYAVNCSPAGWDTDLLPTLHTWFYVERWRAHLGIRENGPDPAMPESEAAALEARHGLVGDVVDLVTDLFDGALPDVHKVTITTREYKDLPYPDWLHDCTERWSHGSWLLSDSGRAYLLHHTSLSEFGTMTVRSNGT